MLILGQKSCILGPSIIKIPQRTDINTELSTEYMTIKLLKCIHF
jgi:hypothetical protein